jgi:hypothetical protein
LNASQVQTLVERELARIASPDRRDRLEAVLHDPESRSFAWDYGALGERYDAWIVGRRADGEVVLVYAEKGFGPDSPWGFVFPADDSLGMDSQWHSGLEDAAIGAGIIEAPPGYVVPGPR